MNDIQAPDPFGLRGRVCAVTGAGSGIGRGIAVALAGVGARVTVIDQNIEGAEETVSTLREQGSEAIAIKCDVSDPTSVSAAAEHSEAALGPCDVLVNNAGLLRAGGLDSLAIEDWNLLLSVNLTGYFLCSQIFGRQMRKRGAGTLIHVASIAATQATAFSGAYSVAKAGVTMLSRQLAIEWSSYGIRSNVVHPGMILTPLSQAMYDEPGATERRSQAIPLGRIGRPDDVAQAVLFLASDRSSYITGDEVTVDGGFTRMLLSLIPRSGFERPVA